MIWHRVNHPAHWSFFDKVIEQAPPENQRLQNYLAALRSSIEQDSRQKDESDQLVSEYEEAYQKLTAPANRLGVFIQWLEDEAQSELPEGAEPAASLALIAVGDQEFVAQVDPKVPKEALATGSRVKVNDAYAIVGFLPPSGNGGMIKVGDVLADGRLRVGSETPGAEGRRKRLPHTLH